jgi:hypothetical protein
MERNAWWEEPKNEAHKALFGYLEGLKNNQAERSEANLRNMRLYGNSEVIGMRIGEFQKSSSLNRISLNVIQMAIDTAVARLSKNKPKPMFITEDGDFSLKRQATLLEQYVMGQFSRLEMYRKAPKALRDSCVFGDGFIYWYFKDNKLCCERVFPEEINVDENEAIYSEPRSITRTKYVSKSVLKSKYPKLASELDLMKAEENLYAFDDLSNDMVTVAETWRLPVGKDKGRHILAIKTATLVDEEYDKDYLPFTRISWTERLMGYFSQGVAEQLTGVQIEINKLLRVIQRSMHLGSIPKVFVENGSKINSNHLNNDIGTIVTYTGTPPTSSALMNVPPELFVQLDKLYQKSFELIGLSQMSVAGEKPSGLNSGKALRTFHDIETERFAVHAQKYEDFYMDAARMIVKLSQDEAKVNPDLKTTVVDRKQMKIIKWSDIKINEDQYVMRIYPTNLLSDTPSGRLADIQEMIEMGLIDKVQAKSLLDYPDIEAVVSLDNAKYDDIQAVIEAMVDKGEYQPPEEFQDLNHGLQMIGMAYLKYKRLGLEDERLELFRQWIEDAMMILQPTEEVIDDQDPILEEEMPEAQAEIEDQLAMQEMEQALIDEEQAAMMPV